MDDRAGERARERAGEAADVARAAAASDDAIISVSHGSKGRLNDLAHLG